MEGHSEISTTGATTGATKRKTISTMPQRLWRRNIFDSNSKTQSGKWIPIDKETGLPHQCQ